MYEYLLDNGMTRNEYHFFLEHSLKQYCILGTDYYRTNEHRVHPDGRTEAAGEVFGYSEITRQYYIAVAPHCPLGPLALASCLQLAACTPNVAIQEMSLGIHYNVGHDLLHFVTDPEVLTPVDGYLQIPRKPALGVTIDEAAVREAHEDRHRWRNPIWRQSDGNFAEW